MWQSPPWNLVPVCHPTWNISTSHGLIMFDMISGALSIQPCLIAAWGPNKNNITKTISSMDPNVLFGTGMICLYPWNPTWIFVFSVSWFHNFYLREVDSQRVSHHGSHHVTPWDDPSWLPVGWWLVEDLEMIRIQVAGESRGIPN